MGLLGSLTGKLTSLGLQHTPVSDEAILKAVDTAIAVPAAGVKRRVGKLRKLGKSDDELIDQLAGSFVKKASVTAGASGAAAIMPGVGTAASLALTGGQLATFMGHAASFVFSVAELKGLDWSERETRRMLLLTALIGPENARYAAEELGVSVGALWSQSASKLMQGAAGTRFNRWLGRYAARKAAKRTTRQLLGRALPLGIGALIGWHSGKKMARQVISGAYAGLGQLEKAKQWDGDDDDE